MPTIRGAVRSVVLSPSLTEVTFKKRGFPVEPSAATQQLEAVPQAVICGFEWGIEARDQWEAERRLAMVDPELRGFAFEGATMAFTIRDVMGRGHRTRDLLLGPGQPHIFLAYIGMGFAMARLPRPLWKKVVPDLDGCDYHPTMSWLAVDGYGFDRAYFDTRRWVDDQHVPAPYPWEGSPGYFLRAVDQGIGRALWFIHGADAAGVAAAVQRFASYRHADLWSGVGLAAAFAGACGPDGLLTLRREAGEHWTELALGVVFAAKARSYAGFVPASTQAAAATLADMSVEAAVVLADGTRPENGTSPDSEHGETPAYEQWRENIRARLAAGESPAIDPYAPQGSSAASPADNLSTR
jgi:enediyne biosynthesis protein E2